MNFDSSELLLSSLIILANKLIIIKSQLQDTNQVNSAKNLTSNGLVEGINQ